MNKIKIPKNWEFKYFEVDGNTTKFVYEDQYHNEHIYIDEKLEPELPTYEELQDKYNKQKEVLDKIKKYCENKIEEQKCMPDFSKSYLENYDKVMNEQHLSHSGVMLETIKSTTTKRCEEILELLEEIE